MLPPRSFTAGLQMPMRAGCFPALKRRLSIGSYRSLSLLKLVRDVLSSEVAEATGQAKHELLSAVRDTGSGAAESNISAKRVDDLIEVLTASSGGRQFSDDLAAGDWVLVYTRNSDGSPVTQKLTRTKPGNTFANFNEKGTFDNIVKFMSGSCSLRATVTYSADTQKSERILCDITDADVKFGWLRIPLPLRAKGGWLDFLYLDEDLRITRGNKGGTFIHIRPDKIEDFLRA